MGEGWEKSPPGGLARGWWHLGVEARNGEEERLLLRGGDAREQLTEELERVFCPMGLDEKSGGQLERVAKVFCNRHVGVGAEEGLGELVAREMGTHTHGL